jgi:hypothetical protein
MLMVVMRRQRNPGSFGYVERLGSRFHRSDLEVFRLTSGQCLGHHCLDAANIDAVRVGYVRGIDRDAFYTA